VLLVVLAAVWAVKTFHTYLHGEEFTLVTDHQPLTFLMTKPDLVSLHARWAITLQQYSFKVVHRPGVQHQNADCLSRLPADSKEDVTGARLHDEKPPPKCSVKSLQISALCAAKEDQDLHVLYDLHHVSTFSETFAPTGSKMITRGRRWHYTVYNATLFRFIRYTPTPNDNA
jgi:hypothetical protein